MELWRNAAEWKAGKKYAAVCVGMRAGQVQSCKVDSELLEKIHFFAIKLF
jgi:hypothetical protein